MGKKAVTLKNIADELSLSVTAVSKALRNESGVAQSTIKKVKDTAKRMNYMPNSIAKSLRTNTTKTLGLVVSDSNFSFFGPLIEGVENTASDLGYNIILCNAYSNEEKEMEAVRVLANKRVDGIILAASVLTELKYKDFLDSFGIPYVFLIRRFEDPSIDFVINDNITGSFQMMDYLLKTGSQNIYFINLYEKIISHSDRFIGYQKALERYSIPFDEKYFFSAKPAVEDGYSIMKQILRTKEPIDAVFCGCDVIAIGVMSAIKESGLSVPDDIRVAGYDDIEFAEYLHVPLTTVRQPKYKIGRLGTEVLVDRIEGKQFAPQNIILHSDLVLRSST